jgi:hypothetical protein
MLIVSSCLCVSLSVILPNPADIFFVSMDIMPLEVISFSYVLVPAANIKSMRLIVTV